MIPTHGRDHLLGEAIASVVAQRHPPTEVLVADDLGSPATRACVEEWAARAPLPVRYVDASGTGWTSAGASRNAGVARATGDVVAFLDDDDTWEPDFLGSVVPALVADGVDFAVGWTAADAGERAYHMERMRPGLGVGDVVARNPGFVGSNFVMRREAFTRLGGFDPELTVSNDQDLLVRALAAGLRYAVVPEVLVRNRIHAGPQLTDKTERRVHGIETYLSKHGDLMTTDDRRYIRSQISSIRRVIGPTRSIRWRSTASLACYRLVEAVRP
ncbi:glycosyltransferase family 2 protein [Pengzhenrongella sicca]|uniref:Glycosyltransferase family 2 protein n=1 Tax=Pengzhenrongella sicca TaxID=2819238 RepID=A0A8A4ZEI9_9MICO|nr:glycosyltransferase family A protein [Pengzhenrongella sicca]QTE28907.1 glycosyltransferase family 2 protein [Pengzhenrongella sicca]